MARQMYFAFMRAYIMSDIKHLLNTAPESHFTLVVSQFYPRFVPDTTSCVMHAAAGAAEIRAKSQP